MIKLKNTTLEQVAPEAVDVDSKMIKGLSG